MASEEETALVNGIITFLTEASTPFHAVKAASDRLRAAGFHQILVRACVRLRCVCMCARAASHLFTLRHTHS